MVKETKILSLISHLEKYVLNFENTNTAVSQAAIGWHIEHTLKVLINITQAIKNSDPAAFKSNFNFVRTIIFITKKIPRGKGKAPKSVQPTSTISVSSLQDSFAIARKSITELYNLDKNKHFLHPYFGNVKLSGTIKFLAIHTNHHLKIIHDIAK
jgi:hypothetical protein